MFVTVLIIKQEFPTEIPVVLVADKQTETPPKATIVSTMADTSDESVIDDDLSDDEMTNGIADKIISNPIAAHKGNSIVTKRILSSDVYSDVAMDLSVKKRFKPSADEDHDKVAEISAVNLSIHKNADDDHDSCDIVSDDEITDTTAEDEITDNTAVEVSADNSADNDTNTTSSESVADTSEDVAETVDDIIVECSESDDCSAENEKVDDKPVNGTCNDAEISSPDEVNTSELSADKIVVADEEPPKKVVAEKVVAESSDEKVVTESQAEKVVAESSADNISDNSADKVAVADTSPANGGDTIDDNEKSNT